MADARRTLIAAEPIRVPDIEHPTLCWKQSPVAPRKPIQRFERCTFAKGHSGPHQWEAHAGRLERD